MKKLELFPTTILEFNFEKHLDLSPLLDLISGSKIGNHDLTKKGVSSYSLTDILSSPKLVNLKADFQKCIDQYCTNLNIKKSNITTSWFNILENGGQTLNHNHGRSVLSGAFYPVLKEGTCNLCFKSPLVTSLNFESLNIFSSHFQEDYIMPIKQNHLYIFPGWLNHYSEKNKGGIRIVVSFNTYF